jgi:protein phosphatase
MKISVPEASLVLLVGPSGSGKSSFAHKYFNKYEIVSSDVCRGMISNDENNQSATQEAFELLQFVVAKRLDKGLLTVVDATNVQASARKSLIELARKHHALPAAIVLNLPQKLCEARNAARTDRNFGKHVIPQQVRQLKSGLKKLKREGFRKIHIFNTEEEVNALEGIEREKLYSNKKEVRGPFDIIGDVHGCYDELEFLMTNLGYQITRVEDDSRSYGFQVTHPEGRRLIFVGDLVDRGPKSPEVLRIVMSMVKSGLAFCVAGNHDVKLQKKLNGKKVSLTHGLAETMEQLENEPEAFKKEVKEFLYSLISHYVFDGGQLVVAHAGLRAEMHGKASAAVRAFCLYGETSGEIDEYGLPVRYNWAEEYRAKAMVVYGHTPIPKAEWLNNTINIDTACVFGGQLTALRYPERELVAVDAKEVYFEPLRPIIENEEEGMSQQQESEELLNVKDFLGKQIIETELLNRVTIKEEQSIAALETMSRFAVHPKWLIYLPPTMSPPETSSLEDYLEHPLEAIQYYKKKGIKQLICEEKHMGSRVMIVICKNQATVVERFGLKKDQLGICYTRSGRNFFEDTQLEQAFIKKVHQGLTQADFWNRFQTNWVALDCELMPWSAKAQALIQNQYAAVGAAARQGLSSVKASLQQAKSRNIEGLEQLEEKFHSKSQNIQSYTEAYQQYCWEVNGIEDYKLAPFHILATEGAVHFDKTHLWHMEEIALLRAEDPSLFKETSYKVINLEQKEDIEMAVQWWLDLTENGGEGMVLKPMDYISFGKGGLLQPAIKCRGRKYLQIIYGPEYLRPENLKRLKHRKLNMKRSLALREFALGYEALKNFVENKPLREVHQAVFGLLALESEAVDPRL